MRVLLTWVQQITVSNTLLCPAMYCVKQNTVSTLALDIHLFNFPLLTCSGHIMMLEPSWPWSYGSWIYNYLCNQCLPPLMLWNWSLSVTCDRSVFFSPGPLVSSTNKTDNKHHQTNKHIFLFVKSWTTWPDW